MSATQTGERDGTLKSLRNAALAAAAAFVIGLWFAPERAWAAFLVAFVLYAGLAVTGPFFLALLVLSRARWPGELRRIPEAATAALPLGALLGVVLISGVGALYEWSHADVVAGDALLAHKARYLNHLGFALRLALCFALWIWLARGLVRAAREHEARPSEETSRRAVRRAALFVVVFAVTFSVACVDWVQSLEPHWFSTIFALVVLSTVALAGVSVAILIAAARTRWLDRDRCEDLGRILIGLALFWAYIRYCQFGLIWYTNMPEETSWYVARKAGEWPTVARAVVVLCWLVPFATLMVKKFRRSQTILARVAIAVLAGSVLQLFYLVAPSIHGAHVGLGVLEIALPAGAVCAFAWCALRALGDTRATAGAEPNAQAAPALSPPA